MRIWIRYFAFLKEERGQEEEEMLLSTSLSVGDLFTQIFKREPTAIRFAVNQMYVSSDTLLEEGDEVVFLPPFGGG